MYELSNWSQLPHSRGSIVWFKFILRFEEALQVFETTGCAGIDVGVIKDAIKEIYDEHVSHIIKQVGDGWMQNSHLT